MLFVFIYVYWYPTRFPYQMMLVLFSSNTTDVTRGTGTANPSGAPSWGRVARSLVFFALFCR